MVKSRWLTLAIVLSWPWAGAGRDLAADGLPPTAASNKPPYQPALPFREFLNVVNKAGNPLDSMPAESVPGLWLSREVAARKVLAAIPVAQVRDLCVPARNHQIPVRVYTPADKKLQRNGKLPILVYYHGGGWTLGSTGTYDSLTRALTNKIPALVVSVDYRLAPEHPFPAAVDDAYLAMEWVARNAEDMRGDPTRIAVAGDSAGGTLATVVALKAKKAGMRVVHQALLYPSVDIGKTDYASYGEFGNGYLLTRKAVETFRRFYLPNMRDWNSADASPLRASSAEIGLLPAALILVAGCDVLRDEGLAYARKLRDNGVPVTCWTKEGMIHGFLSFYNNPVSPAAARLVEPVLDDAAAKIRTAFATGNASTPGQSK
jgi:acetyl esterase